MTDDRPTPRCWRTPAGAVLVEGRRTAVHTAGGPIRTGAGDPVPAAYEYHELVDDAVTTTYGRLDGAIDDDAYGSVHAVVGRELLCYATQYHTVASAVADDGGFERTVEQRVVIAGLTPVAAADALGDDPAARLVQALADRDGREAERASVRHQPVLETRAAFEAALPDCPGGGPLVFVFGYDGDAHVRAPDGRVIWRPTVAWPYRGKDLYVELDRILRRRYGARLARFELDLDQAPWWFWAPDE